MSGKAVALLTSVAIGAGAGTGFAQDLPQNGAPGAAPGSRESQPLARQAARRPGPDRDPLEQRYQIGTMERVLENAVEHGASLWRDRLQALAPVQTLLLDNPRARGYRLEGYGLFFDIDVPSLETTLFSAFRTLDQNGLGIQSAVGLVKSFIQSQAASDTNLQQAIKRIELQVGPSIAALSLATPPAAAADVAGTRAAAGSAALASDAATAGSPPADAILANPEEAYRAEVMRAVIDALLDHSAPLGLSADEWLTVGVRRNEVRPRIGLDSNAQTFIARVHGSDLAAFHAGQLTRDDAIKRVEVRVF